MSNHDRPAPKHRGAPRHAHLAEAPKRAVRNTVVLSSVALAVTGISVGAGMLGKDAGADSAATDISGSLVANGSPLISSDSGSSSTGSSIASTATRASVSRGAELSRGDSRPAADPSKLAGVVNDDPAAITETRSLSQSDPHDIAKALLPEFGFSSSQYGCLLSLWNRESGWNPHAANPSGAYGIPQSLPGSKMASAGADWQNNPVTQIKWGLGYIKDRYGSPCGAWGHSQATGWY